MKKINTKQVLWLCLFALLTPIFVNAQTIIYPAQAQNLEVCRGQSNLTVRVEGIVSDPSTVEVQLAPGIEYLPSSFVLISGTATIAEDITDLNKPVFTLTGITGPIEFTLTRKASCTAYQSVLSGTTFRDVVTVDGVVENTLPNNYEVRYATLNVATPAPLLNADLDSVYTRTFTLQNTGQGCIDTAYLEIDYTGIGIQPAGDLTVDGVTFSPDATLSTPTKRVYKIHGTPAFAGGLCSTDGALAVSEPIQVMNCSNGQVAYKAGWGCSATDLCQTATTSGNVTIRVTNPSLVQTTTITYDSSRTCVSNPYATVRVAVQNTGTGVGLIKQMRMGVYAYAAMTSQVLSYAIDTNSIKVNGVAISGFDFRANDVITTGVSYVPGCLGGHYARAGYIFPTAQSIAPGDSMVVEYKVYTCSDMECLTGYTTRAAGLKIEKYANACGTESEGATSGQGLGIVNYINRTFAQSPAQVAKGSCFNVTIESSTQHNAIVNNGFGEISVLLPDGMTYNPNTANEVIANSILPNYPLVKASSVPSDPDTLVIRFKQNNYGVVMKLGLCIDANAPASLCGPTSIDYTHRYYYDTTCVNDQFVATMCKDIQTDVLCGGPCPTGGISPYAWEFKRVNYGLPDNDQDGKPDTTGSVDFNKIDLSRYQAGDTLRSTYKAVVVNQTAPSVINSWNYAIGKWEFSVGEWKALVADVVIKRGGVDYTATGVPISEVVSKKSFKCDWSSATFTPALPANFKYEEASNDTIFVDAEFIWTPKQRLGTEANPVRFPAFGKTPNYPDADAPEVSTLSHQVVATQANDGTADEFTCFTPLYNANLIGTGIFTYLNYSWPTSSVVGCNQENIGFYAYTRRTSSYAGGQFFFYEYRPVRQIDSIRMTLPQGWEYINTDSSSVRLTYTKSKLNNAAEDSLLSRYNIPITVRGSAADSNGVTVVYNFKPAYDAGLHVSTEGAYKGLLMNVKPSCASSASGVVKLRDYGHFLHYPNGDGSMKPYVIYYNNSLNYNGSSRPSLQIANNSGTVQAASVSNNYWDVEISGTGNEKAPYVWFATEDVSSTSVVRVEYPVGTTITPDTVYGTGKNLYKIDSLGLKTQESKMLRVYFEKSACSLDSVLVKTGWNCTGYPSYPEESCTPTSLYLKNTNYDSEVQVLITEQPALNTTFDPCTVIPYKLRLRSVRQGNLDSAYVVLAPPAGMKIKDNNVTISYPDTNNAEVFTITPLANGSYIVNLENHSLITDDGVLGLKEASSEAERTLFLSYDLYVSDCDYVDGSQAQYTTFAQGVCNGPAVGNGLTLRSNSMKTTPPPATPSLSATFTSSTSAITCQTPTVVSCEFTSSDGNTYEGDSMIVQIPAPLKVKSGSFQVNGGTLLNQTVSDNEIRIYLPAQTVNTPLVQFELEASTSAGCNADTFRITNELFRSKIYNCPSTFGNCNLKERVSTDTIELQVDKPFIETTAFSYTQTGNTIDFQMTVKNNGSNDLSSDASAVNIYCQDTTGAVVHTTSIPAIPAGGTTSMAGTFTYSAGDCANGNLLYVQVQDTTNSGAPACVCSKDLGMLSSGAVLPIRLQRFDGKAVNSGLNQLNWVVDEEAGLVKEYIVERLNNQTKDFEVITNLPATNKISYQEFDRKPTGNDFYRLALVNSEGERAYSNTINIINSSELVGLSVYPNPASKDVTVKWINVNGAKAVTLTVVDKLGKVLMTRARNTTNGMNHFKLDVSALTNGSYIINLTEEGSGVISTKFSVLK